jgi:orotidine-5'-phosphate decarboxylase
VAREQLPFAQRFEQLRRTRGPACLGLDPTPELLAAWKLDDDIWGLRTFCNRVIDAAAQRVSVIKPQSAYFERFGAAGLEVLADIIGSIHALGSLALLDVKRGDIGSTNAAYAEGLLGPDSAMGADAITVQAYFGFGALAPFVEVAKAKGAGLFVVVRSSNFEGERVQRALVAPGLSVAEDLCDEITACNSALAPGTLGPIGAVVGLTAPDAPELAQRLPSSLLLAPGLGSQGGSFDDVRTRFAGARERVLPSSSREVLRRGPDPASLATAIADHVKGCADALG